MNASWQTAKELTSESPSRPIGRLLFKVIIRKSKKERARRDERARKDGG